jgi:hypothetical protein
LLVLAGVVAGQARLRATSAAPFLKDPGGTRLGVLVSGQSYPTGRADRNHLETTIEGWIPSTAVQATTRDGFDLAVTAGAGEALRATPGGAVVARIQEGTLLSRAGTRGTWVRVRRTGWVARSAFAPSDPGPTQIAAAALPPTAPPRAATQPPTPTGARADPAPAADSSAAGRDAPDTAGVAGLATLRAGTAVSVTRDGAPIASLAQAADVAVLEQHRDWTRIRLEGWVRSSDIAAESVAGPKVTAAMLQAAPDRYLNQPVTWRLQFLAVQEADALRPEIPRGQPYVLARGPLPESGFVYLIVSRDQAAEFRRLAPLDEVKVEAIVRAARTRFLPTPVLELAKVLR